MKYSKYVKGAGAFLGVAAFVAACSFGPEPLQSGYFYSMPETQAMQDDDIQNSAFIWVDQGEELWSTVDGEEGKSCESCHGDSSSMKGVSVTYPKFSAEDGKMRALSHQVNACRVNNMKAKEWKWEGDEMLGMTAFISLQSRGLPMNVAIDGEAAPFFELGKAFYEERRGQLDMACANCHIDYPGSNIRADLISNGLPNGFPTFRLKWQKIGSLHRRFRGCNSQVRAEPYKQGTEEYTNLELFIADRAKGVPSEAPSVRR